jgi:polar amino acid transport system substrate-binding protein
MGGDNFIGLIPNLKNPKADISKKIDQLLSIFETSFIIDEEEHFLTSSIGLSFYPLDGKDREVLLKNADTAMHRAKERKGNAFQLYNINMNANITEKLSIRNELRKAVNEKDFLIYYQPIIDLKSGKILKAEALVRWKHPQQGIISPADFIPLAEETGLMVPLGKQILKMACNQVKEWERAGHPIKVSVNLSAQQFHNSNLRETVKGILNDQEITPALLGLEITESIAMQNISLTSVMLEEFRDMDLQILLDDFGTGYSSLSYLTKFGIDVIKIDKSFIRDLPNNPKKDAIISAIITMANKLEIKTIAEGIETEEELKLLQNYNCDQAQGYLFRVPLPPEEFSKLLAENRALI